MSKPVPARYRTTNWPEYNAALRRRGFLLVWLDRDMEWLPPASDRVGRPQTFSDAAIQFCFSLKVLFGLALRQTIGMVASLLRMVGLEDWPVPDTSTLCRREKTVGIQIPFRREGGPLHLLVDSTGVKMRGDGEWQVRRHGASRRRQWRKVHRAMDAATGDIRAVEFTRSREGDIPCFRIFSTRFHMTSKSARSQPMAPSTPNAVTPRSSTEARPPSSRSAGMAVLGKRMAQPQGQGMTSSEP